MSREQRWAGRTVLVTGISGFLGAWLAEALLEQGAVVAGFDRTAPGAMELHEGLADRVTMFTGDMTVLEDVEQAIRSSKADTCFHLAGHSMVDPENRSPLPAFEANARGTWVVLEAARRVGSLARIMVASSNHVYGHQGSTPSTEDAALNGTNPYAASKACTDIIARCFAESYRMPIGIARNTNSFGGADPHLTHIVTASILSLLRGEAPVIQSDGSPVKSYLYVRDTIEGYLRLADRSAEPEVRGQPVNFSMDEPVSVAALVSTLITVSGATDISPRILGAPGQWHEREWLSNARAKSVLGWRPQFTLKDGLRETYEWYRARVACTKSA